MVALHGKLREPIAFPLRIRGARVASTEFEHLHTAEKLNVNAELQSHLGSTVLGLVKGGWLGKENAGSLLCPLFLVAVVQQSVED